MSKLVNKSRLESHTQKLWDRIKNQLTNGTYKNAELSADGNTLTLTKNDNTTTVIDLSNFAKTNIANNFTENNTFKDVLINEAITVDNSNFSTTDGGYDPAMRSMGVRNLSSGLFGEGYVNKLRIFTTGNTTIPVANVNIWSVTKGTTKNNDMVAEQIITDQTYQVQTVGNQSFIEIEINRAFPQDTYFIVRTNSPNNFKSLTGIGQELVKDVVNFTNAPTLGQALPLDTVEPNWGGHMSIIGKVSVKEIINYILNLSNSMDNYVLKSELTDQGGATNAGKPVKLDVDGKLNENMMPSIAINEVFNVQDFNNASLAGITYQAGDIVIETSSTDRYYCFKVETTDRVSGFIKLNDKTGTVTSVNGETGAVELALDATNDKISLNVNGLEKSSIDIISEQEIIAIIDALQ